jgi:hypothetical protein
VHCTKTRVKNSISVPAKFTAKARWHPREAQAAREQAQEITYLIKQALKDGNNYLSSDSGVFFKTH